MKPSAILDVETGGTDASKHPLLSFAVQVVDRNMHATKEPFQARIKADPALCDPKALEINKLDPTEGKEPEEVIEDFKIWKRANYIPKLQLIAYNVVFDDAFMKAFLKDEYYTFFTGHTECILSVAKFINRKYKMKFDTVPFRSLKLVDVAKVLNVPVIDAHDAMGDVRMERAVYQALHRL